ncbi:MAG TPA: hypothetical protein VGE38_11595 [Nocardioides sp.]|uniref:hypothetical protein n=1 Tax=Nocardioides sp. TaxID=35761 RepID=UPI002ED7A518
MTRGRLLGLAVGLLMVVVGGFWTAVGLGWAGEESGTLATVGPAVAGLGVALVWVTLQPRR